MIELKLSWAEATSLYYFINACFNDGTVPESSAFGQVLTRLRSQLQAVMDD